MPCENKLLNAYRLPPLFNGIDVVDPSLLGSHLFLPLPPRRQSHPKGIQCVDLEVVLEMLERPDEGKRRASVAMKQDYMRVAGIPNSVKLMHVLSVVYVDVPVLEFSVELQIRKLERLVIGRDELLGHHLAVYHGWHCWHFKLNCVD